MSTTTKQINLIPLETRFLVQWTLKRAAFLMVLTMIAGLVAVHLMQERTINNYAAKIMESEKDFAALSAQQVEMMEIIGSAEKIVGQILFAPALQYYRIIHNRYQDQWENWEKKGYITLTHPLFSRPVKWSWNYVRDLSTHSLSHIEVPTLLIHGEADDVVPISDSKEFVARGDELISTFYPEKGDHPLNNVLAEISEKILYWLEKQPNTIL